MMPLLPRLYLLDTQKAQAPREALVKLLNPQELRRLKAFNHQGREWQFLWSRALLHIALKDTFSSPLKHRSNQSGAIELIDCEARCSLSHSGHWIVLALQACGDIGVDIEVMKERQYLSIAKEYFTAPEYEAIRGSKNAKQYFYSLWTLKEAYAKMAGGGIFGPALSTIFEPHTAIEESSHDAQNPVYGCNVQLNNTSLSFTSSASLAPEVRMVLICANAASNTLDRKIEVADFSFHSYRKVEQ